MLNVSPSLGSGMPFSSALDFEVLPTGLEDRQERLRRLARPLLGVSSNRDLPLDHRLQGVRAHVPSLHDGSALRRAFRVPLPGRM